MRNAIAFSVDSNYLSYAHTLIKSSQSCHVSADMICRGINLSDEEVMALKGIDPSINIIRDNVNLNTKKVLMKDLPNPEELYWTYEGTVYDSIGMKNIMKTMYSELAAYSCHSRFKTITETLATDIDTLLCLDADTYINKNIDELFGKSECDMYVVPYGHDRRLFHNEGLLLINNTERSREFFTRVESKIFSGRTYHGWDIDTKVLTEVYNDIDINIGMIDDTYKDKQHLLESHMWSGDGPRKDYPTFKRKIDR